MAGKCLRTPFGTSILCFLILSMVLAQTHIEATSCCQGPWGRACYEACMLTPLGYATICAGTCGCTVVDGSACPPGYPSISPLQIYSSAQGARIEYCKLGCASSVCNAMSTVQNYGERVVENCHNACSAFCTKGSTIALKTA